MPKRKKDAPKGAEQRSMRSKILSEDFPRRDRRQRTLVLCSQQSMSLQQVALNTESRHTWNSDSKLRHTQVHFVSAGEIQLSKPKESADSKSSSNSSEEVHHIQNVLHIPEQSLAKLSIEPRIEPFSNARLNIPTTLKSGDLIYEGAEAQKIAASLCLENDFVPDLRCCAEPINSEQPHLHKIRPSSPVSSDSSEEIILFCGRGQNQSTSSPHSLTTLEQQKTLHEIQSTSKPQSLTKSAGSTDTPFSQDFVDSPRQPLELNTNSLCDEPLAHHSNISTSKYKLGLEHIEHYKKRHRRSRNTDIIMADYIANAKALVEVNDYCFGRSVNHRLLGNSDGDLFLGETASSDGDGPEGSLKEETVGNCNATILHVSSTSNEIGGPFFYVLSRRRRPSGFQYLVVREGDTPDDAIWISSSALNMPDAIRKIRTFDEIKEIEKRYQDEEYKSDETFISSNQLVFDLREDQDHTLLEEGFLQSEGEGETDKQIARLLSKQGVIGLGLGELILHDDDGHVNLIDGKNKLIQPPMVGRQNVRIRTARRGSDRGDILNTAIGMDPCAGFDIMDYNRASLKSNSKDRKHINDFEALDSELKETMELAWEQDRKIKRSRKLQREELRSQGLLGRKNKLDIKAKYPEGMTTAEVKSEIKDFLTSTSERLSLPPMDKEDRMLVHYIANTFSLKSKSVGGGRSRFPVLYKTSRTQTYCDNATDNIDARMNLPFFPRTDKVSKKGRNNGRRNGGNAASYHDGEVVGATAPELGIENRGRAMLEKMGWSTGTALGATNNKGIMQPLAHVVKTTKAGLG